MFVQKKRTWLAWTHQAEVTILAFQAAERQTVMHPVVECEGV
jgi:hypothetical protein